MFRDKIKINSGLEQIKNNFFTVSQSNIIYQTRVTRKGIAIKTILLLLFSALSAGMVYYSLSNYSLIDELPLYLIFMPLLVTFISYRQGISSVSSSKICSFVYSIFSGISIGCVLDILKIRFGNVVLQLAALALFSTFFIFLVVSYLYYNGSLALSADAPLVKNMYLIFLVLFGVEIFYFFVLLFSGSQSTWFSLFFNTFLTIPINLFFICFSVVVLILHFNYVENMVMNSMPKKYEWQLSLVFVSLFISIFIRILNILIRLKSLFSEKD